ncbi:MAG TPA: hypothetical protein PLW95_00380 [bacterium]|nr:hypothetical protein [bacterium]
MNKKLITLIVIALFVFEYQFIITPLNKKIRSTANLINKKKNDYETLKNLIEEYNEKNRNKSIENAKIVNKNFSLFSFVGKIIEENALVSNIKSINPLPVEKKDNFEIEKIKLNIDNIPLEKLLKFLANIEESNFPVYISEFSMVRNKTNPSLLIVNMEIIVIKNG